jgi:NADPH:quinone reductase-like Zn-dependent oxidoreductase
MGKRVLPYPAVNWQKDTKGPDVAGKPFGLFGGTKETEGLGMFAEYVCVDSSYCVEAPSYLSDEAAAAVPVASLTAWRALVTKAGIKPGDNVLITGIGGGVAMQALQFAVALGARVWVTSGSEEKLNKAKELGAEGGVIYKQEGWAERLKSMLPSSKQFVDVVIDGSGGNIVTESNKIMTDGGIVVGYGATTGKPVTITMNEILRNIEYKSATMGSLAEYKKMIEFMNKHHVEPVVCDVVNGLDQADEAFQILQKGEQCGKVVMKISGKGQPAQPSKRGSH